MSRSRYENIQSDLMAFIPESCFFLSLLSVAEDVTNKPTDFIGAYKRAKDEYWLGKDNMMYNDTKLLEWLTGKKVTKEVHMGPLNGRTIADNEYTICKYRRGSMTHFCRRGYDVYKDSLTVLKGRLDSIYIYRFE